MHTISLVKMLAKNQYDIVKVQLSRKVMSTRELHTSDLRATLERLVCNSRAIREQLSSCKQVTHMLDMRVYASGL